MSALSEPELLAALDGAMTADTLARTGKLLNSDDFVHASGQWVALNEGADIILTVNIDAGYHINANPASDAYLVATQLLLDGHPEVKVEYPQSQTFKAAFAPDGIDVYQGRITLRAHLPQHEDLPLPVANLRVQACNEEVCLLPATITVPLSNTPAHSTKADQE